VAEAATPDVAQVAAAVVADAGKPAGPGAQQPAQQAGPAPAPVAVADAPAKQQTGGQQQPGQQQAGQQPTPQTADQARAAVEAYSRTAQPRQQEAAAPATPAAPAPVVAPTAQAPVAQHMAPRMEATPVPVSHAAETVEHVLRLGSSRGTTHARVTLNPAELGSIDLHLRQTADGLVAKVTAHAPEAVMQLQQAAAELRRSLEQQGVNVLSLDIGQHAGDERAAGRAGGGFAGDGGNDGRGQGAAGGSAAGDGADVTTTKTTLQLPNGVLVDVLA
jgi:flagellar hook-length control protein FliK